MPASSAKSSNSFLLIKYECINCNYYNNISHLRNILLVFFKLVAKVLKSKLATEILWHIKFSKEFALYCISLF